MITGPFTDGEKKVLEMTDREFTWISRGENGDLWLSNDDPDNIKISNPFDKMRKFSVFNNKFKSVKPNKAFRFKIDVLDSTEKRYLEAVLRPLPKVISIKKCACVMTTKQEFLDVEFEDKTFMSFPCFSSGTMYTGMSSAKLYTPEDLGLNLRR